MLDLQGLMCCCLLSLAFLIQMRTFILSKSFSLAKKNASTLLRMQGVLGFKAPFLLLYISRLRLSDADLERRVPSAAYEVCGNWKQKTAPSAASLPFFLQGKVKGTDFESTSSSYTY